MRATLQMNRKALPGVSYGSKPRFILFFPWLLQNLTSDENA